MDLCVLVYSGNLDFYAAQISKLLSHIMQEHLQNGWRLTMPPEVRILRRYGDEIRSAVSPEVRENNT